MRNRKPHPRIHEPTVIFKERLITNKELAEGDPDIAEWFQEIQIDSSSFLLEINSGKLLVIDPTYLADIYNQNGPNEKYLKKNGVVLTDFGGDVSGPVFRTECGGLKIFLLFDRVDEQGRGIFRPAPDKTLRKDEIDSDNLGCDSGSYIFLDYNQILTSLFKQQLLELKKSCGLFIVDLALGAYGVGYEQWETNRESPYESWCRNIVIWPVKR